MPAYTTLDSLPQAKALETWAAFNARLVAPVEMGWLNGNIIRHDITALPEGDSPLLCSVKFADDWERGAVGKNPPYKCTYDFGLRLYMYVGNWTVNEIEAQYDLLENANEMMVRVLRSEYMACNGLYWQALRLVGGENGKRTSYIRRDSERLSITTNVMLIREFRPGN